MNAQLRLNNEIITPVVLKIVKEDGEPSGPFFSERLPTTFWITCHCGEVHGARHKRFKWYNIGPFISHEDAIKNLDRIQELWNKGIQVVNVRKLWEQEN